MIFSKPGYSMKPILAFFVLLITVLPAMACASAHYPSSQQPPESNKGLVIRYLTAPKQVMPSRGTEILCVATDASGGAMRYEWSATGGEIQPRKEPETVFWVAPAKEGNYIVTVVVTSTSGARVTRSVNIAVTKEADQRPIIYGVKCLDCRDGVEASRFSQYMLRCDASAPTGGTLRYTWFANLGRIKSEGATATWFTGSQYGNALITVIVTDDKGNEAEGYLAISVSCCN